MGGADMMQAVQHPHDDLLMPGEAYIGQTDKPKEKFREYTEDAQAGKVKETYRLINTLQTVESVKENREKWGRMDKELTINEVLGLLTKMIDESDPDTVEAQQVHGYQTAERCRELFPDLEWMHLVGLIHDCGKVMALWGQPQWATVGDTFPVGCEVAREHVFSEFWCGNPDSEDVRYQTKYGMYQEGCGLDRLLMSWGHDEYLYMVLKANGCTIPEEGLHIIRYHSFYAHHQHNAYAHFCTDKDLELRDWLRKFQKCDLYSKSAKMPNVEEVKGYYDGLIEKYCPGKLRW